MTTPLPPDDDPELADLFAADPELREVYRLLQASRPDPVVGPHFRAYLRARLLDAAEKELRPRGWRRRLGLAPTIAWGGVVVGVALIAAAVATAGLSHPTSQVADIAYASQIEGRADVDPSDVIRISFDRPMDHQAVVSGLHIQPATAFSAHWDGNTLVIVPAHHLAPNTPYTVTVPRQSARTPDGRMAAHDVHITFGTQPTPSAAPTPPPVPSLVARPLGTVGPGSPLLFLPDGSLLVGDGPVPTPTPSPSGATSATPAPTPTPTRTPKQTPTGSTTPGSTPSATASGSPSQSDGVLRFTPDGRTVVLGDPASALAESPDGRYVASLVPIGSGADVRIVAADGSQAATLTHQADPGSPIAWSPGDGQPAVVFLSGGVFRSVDLGGRVRTLGGHLRVAPGQVVVLSPDGKRAYLGPLPPSSASTTTGSTTSAAPTGSTTATSAVPATTSTTVTSASAATPSASPGPGSPAAGPASPLDGTLVDLRTGASVPLTGSASGIVAFSGDGGRVVWIGAPAGMAPVLESLALGSPPGSTPSSSTPTITSLPQARPGDVVTDLALDGDGGRAALVLDGGSGSRLEVVDLTTGSLVGVFSAPTIRHPVFSPAGDAVAALTIDDMGRTVAILGAVAPVTQMTPSPSPTPTPSASAAALVDEVVAAQLGRRGAPGFDSLATADAAAVLSSQTPPHLTRAYVIRVVAVPAAPGGSGAEAAEAEVRLIRDPTETSPTLVADEVLSLRQPAPDQPYRVTAVRISPLAPEPTGPQVVHVDTSSTKLPTGARVTVVRIVFDSDLNPATVAGAVRVLDGSGRTIAGLTTYDAESRTIVVTVASGSPAGVEVSTSLRDVDDQPLATAFHATIGS